MSWPFSREYFEDLIAAVHQIMIDPQGNNKGQGCMDVLLSLTGRLWLVWGNEKSRIGDPDMEEGDS